MLFMNVYAWQPVTLAITTDAVMLLQPAWAKTPLESSA